MHIYFTSQNSENGEKLKLGQRFKILNSDKLFLAHLTLIKLTLN